MTRAHMVTVVVAVLALALLATGAAATIPDEVAEPRTEDGSGADNTSVRSNTSDQPVDDMQPSTSPTRTTSNGQAAIDTPAPGDGDGSGGWAPTGVWVGLVLLGLTAVGVHQHDRRARERKPDPEPRALEHSGVDGALIMARRAHREDRIRLAEEWFATAIELEDTRPIAHLCRGLCLIELEELEAAITSLRRALELETSATTLYHLARAHALQADVQGAVAAIAPLVQADPSIVADLREDPAFARLRDDPRWLAALGELG